MAPKRAEDGHSSDYSYVTDEEEDDGEPPVLGPEPPSAAPGEATTTGPRSTHGPPCATSKRRAGSPSPSSEEPGPRYVRPRHRSSRTPLREEAPRHSVREPPRGVRDRSTRPESPPREGAAPEPTSMDAGGMHATRSKGPSKGKRTHECPHCWTAVAWSPKRSGLSQHMWWSADCIAWQIYGQGDCSWDEAVNRAHQVKYRREQEAWGELRSAKHRAELEERLDEHI